MKVHVYTRADGRWDFRCIHPNGRILAGSDQGYEHLENAVAVATQLATGQYMQNGGVLQIDGHEDQPILPTATPYVFRVIREKVDDQTVRVLLEPYTDIQHVEVHEGDAFITGTLAISPWEES